MWNIGLEDQSDQLCLYQPLLNFDAWKIAYHVPFFVVTNQDESRISSKKFMILLWRSKSALTCIRFCTLKTTLKNRAFQWKCCGLYKSNAMETMFFLYTHTCVLPCYCLTTAILTYSVITDFYREHTPN